MKKKTSQFILPGGVIGPDLPDVRDFLLVSVQPPVTLPSEYLLRDKMTSVQTQYYGTCTSLSADGVAEFQENLEYKPLNGKEIKLANRFIYYNTKVISGLWNDEGDYLRNAFKAVEKFGVPFEEDFPDQPENNWREYISKKPSEEVYQKALIHKADGYARVANNLEAFNQAVYQNQSPSGFSMMWYESYRKIGPDGHLPPAAGQEIGGHAVDYTGWKEEKAWTRNSWGKSWGNNGYFYIPFNEFYLHNIWDAWILYPLPNDWQAITKMWKLVKEKGKDPICVEFEGEHYWIDDMKKIKKGIEDKVFAPVVEQIEPLKIVGIWMKFPWLK